MSAIGKYLFVLGLVIAAVGIALWLGAGKTYFGKLPGDILIERGRSTFYFPITTCLLISIAASAVMWLLRK